MKKEWKRYEVLYLKSPQEPCCTGTHCFHLLQIKLQLISFILTQNGLVLVIFIFSSFFFLMFHILLRTCSIRHHICVCTVSSQNFCRAWWRGKTSQDLLCSSEVVGQALESCEHLRDLVIKWLFLVVNIIDVEFPCAI